MEWFAAWFMLAPADGRMKKEDVKTIYDVRATRIIILPPLFFSSFLAGFKADRSWYYAWAFSRALHFIPSLRSYLRVRNEDKPVPLRNYRL